jgi:predicted Rossmann fold nucleotide-binding protein DprA/Smf involved in DNA uptake
MEELPMPKLQSELNKISKALVSLSKQVERISKQVDKKQPAKKTAAKRKAAPARKPAARKTAAAKGKTVLDTVFNAIKRSKNGVSVAQLKQRTRLDARQLSNALYKLSKKGQVYAKSRGVYVKK